MPTIKLCGELGLVLKNNELKLTVTCIVNDIDPQLLGMVNKEVIVVLKDDQTTLDDLGGE